MWLIVWRYKVLITALAVVGSCSLSWVAVAFAQTGADLSIVVLDDPDPARPGARVTYTIHVFNSGPGVAPNVQVIDRWAVAADNFREEGVTFLSVSPNRGNCF